MNSKGHVEEIAYSFIHNSVMYTLSCCFNGCIPNLFEQVVRQHEEDLAKAVEELCDGSPSSATLDLLRNLNKATNIVDQQKNNAIRYKH